MKPCCFPDLEQCFDIVEPYNEWECEYSGGKLGPEGTCCQNSDEGDCDPLATSCWKCPWDIIEPSEQVLSTCCFPHYAWQFFGEEEDQDNRVMEGQCTSCRGNPATLRENCHAEPGLPTRPCCTPNPLTGLGRCINLALDELYYCDPGQQYAGTLGPPGTCCRTHTPSVGHECDINDCWLCEWETTGVRTSCCFPDLDNHWMRSARIEQCHSCDEMMEMDTITGLAEGECVSPIPEPECIDAPREDRYAPSLVDNDGRHLQWSLNTIGTVVFGESGTVDEVQGYHYPISTHLIRPRQAETPAQSCGHAVGRMTMLHNGYVYLETCSKPDRTSEDSFRRSYGLMRTFLPEGDTPLALKNRALGMQDGYQYDVTCIRLPWWAEATYRSHTAICGGDPQ